MALLLFSMALFGQDYTVATLSDAGFKRPVEPSIAINPRNTDEMVAAAIRFGDMEAGEPRVVNVRYHTTDGGKSWQIVPELNPEARVQGDDVVAYNAEGVAYHSYIAFRGLKTKLRKANGIWVTYSGENAEAWQGPVKVIDHDNTHRPYEDKPWIATDNSKTSPHYGNVYIAWTRFDTYFDATPADSSQIYFSRSTNGGKSFAPPYRISDTGGNCLDDDYTVEGAVPAAGPDGTVYIAWSGPRGLMFKKSMDGGQSFTREKVLTELVGGWNIDIPGILRCNGFPVTETDISEGAFRGSVYINWIDQRFGDPDVFVMYSRDGGENWSKPVRVNDDALFNDKAQFFTWMSVDPVDGAINVAFYDRRNSDDTTTELYLARSVDGGKSFKNFRLSKIKPFQCNAEVFFGDYLNVDAVGGRVAIIFPVFTSAEQTAIQAAVIDFVPGTLEMK
jgi:hypothetical protein